MRRNNLPSSQRGIALITVSWMILILALIISASLSIVKNHYSITQHNISYARSQLMNESGVHWAIAELINNKNSILHYNETKKIQFDGQTIEIRVENENGKFDLNQGDSAIFSALLASVGVKPQEALAIEQHLINKRLSVSGVAFHTIKDIAKILPFDESLYQCISRTLTVHSNKPNIELKVASDKVKEALLWANKNNWKSKDWLTISEISILKSGQTLQSITRQNDNAGTAYTIYASTHINKQWQSTQKAIVRITKDTASPYWIYDWQTVHSSPNDCKNFSM